MKGPPRIGLAFAVLVVSSAVASCSSPATQGGVGASCLVFTDCQASLVCAPVGAASGPKACTASTATLVMTEDAGAAAQSDAAKVSNDGAASGDAPAAPDEASAPDEAAAPVAADAGEET